MATVTTQQAASARATRRILVVANETCGPALCEAIQAHAGDTTTARIFIIAPALTRSRLSFWATDLDAAEAAATEKLRHALDCIRILGLQAGGHIGDPDPVQAIADALYEFPADEILVATHPEEHSNWLERHVVERAKRRFRLPITHVVVER